MRGRALLELIYACGLRASEVTALDIGSINLETGYVKVFGKGGKERMVPVGSEARRFVARYLEGRKAAPGSSLFPRMTRQALWGIIKKQAKKSGLSKKVYPHLQP